MLRDLSWFEDRVGFTILRNNTEIEITGFEMAKKLFEIQDKNYTFSDKLRVHRAPVESCAACEA